MAGLIPQHFIDELLNRLDIVDVIDRRVKLKKTGKNYSACCPFHDEKTPSFSVNPDKQFYYCFGCGAGGNALGFVMDYERLSFPEAVENLAQTAGLEVPREQTGSSTEGTVSRNKPTLDVLEQAAIFYEQALRKHSDRQKVIDYLKGRGLTGAIAKEYRIGFAPPGWDNLLVAIGTEDPTRTHLMEAGLLVKNEKDRSYDRFRDRVMFPIVDQRGRVIAFGGRVLGDDKPKYLNSPETPVFHKSRELYGLYQARKANRSLERVVVVEGYMDVIALAQFGIRYAVATLGTATSEDHLARLYRVTPEVVFCFDGDEAGRKAAFRALESTLGQMQDGRQARFLFLPEGEDPDTLVRAKGAEHLELLFSSATPLETFLFEQLAVGIELSTMDGRARFSKVVSPYLHRLPDGVFKTLMYQSLANRTGIDVSSLKRLQTPEPTADAASSSFSNRQPDASFASDASADWGDAPPPSEPPADYDDYLPAGATSWGEPDHSPLQRLLGLIILRPHLAGRLSTEAISGDDRLSQLVRDVIEQAASEDCSTAMLLGYWYGTPEGALMTKLAGREQLEDDAGLLTLFEALTVRLAQATELSDLRGQFNALKTRDYGSLSTEEKRQLLDLTQQIRALTGRQ